MYLNELCNFTCVLFILFYTHDRKTLTLTNLCHTVLLQYQRKTEFKSLRSSVIYRLNIFYPMIRQLTAVCIQFMMCINVRQDENRHHGKEVRRSIAGLSVQIALLLTTFCLSIPKMYVAISVYETLCLGQYNDARRESLRLSEALLGYTQTMPNV